MKRSLPLILLSIGFSLYAQSELPGYDGFWKNDKVIQVWDLVDYTQEELGLLRNEIFAKYGRTFRTARYQEHFDAQDWYTRKSNFQDDWLSPIDYENVNTILSVERPAKSAAEMIAFVTDQVQYEIEGFMRSNYLVIQSSNQLQYVVTKYNPYFNDTETTDYHYLPFGPGILMFQTGSLEGNYFQPLENGRIYFDTLMEVKLSQATHTRLMSSLSNG